MAPIQINGNRVDFNSRHPKNSSFDAGSEKTGNYMIALTKHPLRKAELQQLSELGADLQESLGSHAYLFRYASADFGPIRKLEFVEKAGDYHRGYKISSQLQAEHNLDPTQRKNVLLVLHEDKSATPQEAATEIAQKAGLRMEDVDVQGNRVQMNVALKQLKELSKVDAVRVVEEVTQPVLSNDLARRVLNAEIFINDTAYQGEGQVIAVADSGFDRGKVDDTHPAFTGRVRELIPIGRPTQTNDPTGHGTHCCGSILGARTGPGSHEIEGIAPKAELVVQSLLNDVPPPKGPRLFPPNKSVPLETLFVPPMQKWGAYIHNNSWATEWSGHQKPYGEEARQIDQVVFENPELLILFAAGNDGVKSPFATVTSFSAAKNCLTVGATESLRPSISGRFASGKRTPNDTAEISYYSSRGPTREGRIKPDVVAPGTAILSTLSRDAKDISEYGVSSNPLFMYSTGTSMATPLVSGCAAVLREALIKDGVQKPSAALLKALLINGAFALHHAHDAREGFGRVDLKASIVLHQDVHAGYAVGHPLNDAFDEYTVKVDIPTPADAGVNVTLRVTLAYTDKPGPALQNILNLIVVASDLTQRHGNMGSNGDLFDETNNVEQVMWRGIAPGQATIIVRATQVLTKEQDFAMVWSLPDLHTEQ